MIWQEIKWYLGNIFTGAICALCVRRRKRLPLRLLFSWGESSQHAQMYVEEHSKRMNLSRSEQGKQ